MKRIQLFEFGDQNWFPLFLKHYDTDFLAFLSQATKMYVSILPLLEKSLHSNRTTNIIDLCSGSGGNWRWLSKALQKNHPKLKVTLTDYFPNKTAFTSLQKETNNLYFYPQAVDARKVPQELEGLRTLFLSFHHFTAKEAQEILQNAIDTNSGIAIFEAQERSLPSLLAMLFSPLTLFVVTPFIRPFELRRLLFTYLIPILPLVVLWDVIVSALRTYSVPEMRALVEGLTNREKLDWEIGSIKSGPGKLLYLIGNTTSNTKAKAMQA